MGNAADGNLTAASRKRWAEARAWIPDPGTLPLLRVLF